MRTLLLVAIAVGCSSAETSSEQPDVETVEDSAVATDSVVMPDVGDEGVDTSVEETAVLPDVASETSDAPVIDAPTSMKSAGCLSGKDLTEGAATITVGGVSRKYTLRKPAGYTKDKAWPLVLALHPNGSNMGYYDTTTGSRAMRPLMKDKGILVLPNARVDDWRGDLLTDLAYFEALIGLLKKEMCIDESRIFSMGFSGGGSFSGVLGCSRTDIRAIAVGGAVIYFDKTKCVGKPAAWITIGDGEAVPERIAYRDFWRTRNECTTMTTVVPPAATCGAYNCPDPGRPVHFCSHAGGHEWPSFGAQGAWDFFTKF